ncbi:MAG: Fic family protein [Patescibacteria group bacterium]|nr:Fic family protein [Patescibacteria group bacterium]
MYVLRKPKLSQEDKDKVAKLLENPKNKGLFDAVQSTFKPYISWEKSQYKKMPQGVTPEQFWHVVKTIRGYIKTETIIKDEDGNIFTWIKTLPGLEEFFHNIDFDTGGQLKIPSADIDEKKKMQFISRGIIEEAIASSQLEGAHTTRRVAKKMIQEGRKPRTTDEKMILNNYETMKAIEEEYKEKILSLEMMIELHKMITKDTFENPDQEGRIRNKEEDIIVTDDKIIYHIAPNIKFVKEELNRLIKFANDEFGEPFLHPVIKAIMIHFWIGYLHPFPDGNGRIARALFYWYLLRNGYWAFAYLPISKIIKNSSKQYGMAYVYSEQDDNDLTYFIDYNIRKIEQAIDEFKDYATTKAGENRIINKLSKNKYNLNDRQIRLLQYYFEEKDAYTTTKTYTNIYQVSKKTAINDLKKLKRSGFLYTKKRGRNVLYYSTDKIKELLH